MALMLWLDGMMMMMMMMLHVRSWLNAYAALAANPTKALDLRPCSSELGRQAAAPLAATVMKHFVATGLYILVLALCVICNPYMIITDYDHPNTQ
jgi:hypothetical protein